MINVSTFDISLPWVPSNPEWPWSRLHVDYVGPLQGHTFLVLVDAYSKWMEVCDGLLIGASVSEPPSSDANDDFLLYILLYIIIYYVSYVVPHILNLSNLTHVTSIKYV